MTAVTIGTSRGISLRGDWIAPVNCRQQAVIFIHGFLADRYSYGWFDSFAKVYRSNGYATLLIDLSGNGESDDEAINLASQTDDLMAICSWVKEQGYPEQVVHAHGFGGTVALMANPEAIRGYILCAPLLGPVEIAWEEVFSEQQLSELEKHGHTRIPDDLSNKRDYTIISKQTLRDLSAVNTESTLANLAKPTLFVADDVTLQSQWFAPIMENPQLLLPRSIELLVRQDVCFDLPFPSDTPEFAANLRQQTLMWLQKTLPVQ